MTAWDLETGNERPVRTERRGQMMSKVGIGAITKDEVIRRVELLGARTVLSSGKIKVYPPDTTQNPVFIGERFGNGMERANVISRLRAAGLDIMDEEALQKASKPTAPTPADAPRNLQVDAPRTALVYEKPVDAVVADPDAQFEMMFEMLAEADRRISVLETASEDQRRTNRRLSDRVATLERQQSTNDATRVVAKSMTELLREAVLVFFESHPGVKMTPEMVKANLDPERYESLNNTAVAGACGDLAKSGHLQGGGKKGTGQPQTTRGIYWYEPKNADDSE